MGFLKTVALRRHAERIATGFSTLRTQQFDAVLTAIEKGIPERISGQRTLSGNALHALKAYQLLVFTLFSIEHPYVSETDFREFAGHLTIAVSGADRAAVETYFKEFNEYAIRVYRQGSEEAYGENLTRISIPIADHMVPDPNPIAWSITATLMPIFNINIQMVIAAEFRDKQTLKALQHQMEVIREQLVQEPPASETAQPFPPSSTSSRGMERPVQSDIVPSDLEAMIERGQYYRESYRSVGEWEDRMVKQFGQNVIPMLPEIWEILTRRRKQNT